MEVSRTEPSSSVRVPWSKLLRYIDQSIRKGRKMKGKLFEQCSTLFLTASGCQDTQHSDTQYNDTQNNDTQNNDIQHNDTKHNDTQYYDTEHKKKRNTKHKGTESCYAESRHAEYNYSECRLCCVANKLIMLSVVK